MSRYHISVSCQGITIHVSVSRLCITSQYHNTSQCHMASVIRSVTVTLPSVTASRHRPFTVTRGGRCQVAPALRCCHRVLPSQVTSPEGSDVMPDGRATAERRRRSGGQAAPSTPLSSVPAAVPTDGHHSPCTHPEPVYPPRQPPRRPSTPSPPFCTVYRPPPCSGHLPAAAAAPGCRLCLAAARGL